MGRADKGLVMTTGTFSTDARREATRDGAPAIDLVDGETLCELLKGLKIGVSIQKVEHVLVFFFYDIFPDAPKVLSHLGVTLHSLATWWDVLAEARAQGRDVKLEALKQSDSNRFYLRHGFVLEGEEEFDLLYRWPVQQGVAA